MTGTPPGHDAPEAPPSDQPDPYYFASAQPGTARPPHTGISRWTAVGLVLVALLVAGVAVLNLVHVAKVVFHPGPVYNTLGKIDDTQVVQVEGLATYPTSGTLDFTTIIERGSPSNQPTAWQWLTAELDPSLSVVDQDLVYPPNVTQAQVQEENVALMRDSQQGAAVVALRAQGITVPEHIKVAQIVVDAPASGVLKVNDEVLTVGGKKVTNPEQIRQQLQTHAAGSTVDFEVIRDGKTIELAVPTRQEEVPLPQGGTEKRTVIGVYLASDFDLPYTVKIDAGNVGGPSAGLMFSLAVYDSITPGALTGGKNFAGTGTIDSSGTVGPIGGIAQKMIGAQRAGAQYFLAPAGNCAEVTGHVPDGLVVAKVATFDEARSVIEDVAAGQTSDLPTC